MKKLRLFSLLMSMVSVAYAGQVPVFYSSDIHPKKREKALLSAGISGTKFVVYSSYSEFDSAAASSPDVVIAPSNFSNANYSKALVFTKGGSKTFKYKIISLEDKWNAGNLGTASVGVVAVAGMSEMDAYIKGNAKLKTKIVKTVSKPDDLFPMLVLKSANVVAMEEHVYNALKSGFGSPAKVIVDSAAVELPAVFIKKGADLAALKSTYSSIPPRVLKLLGFDGIK